MTFALSAGPRRIVCLTEEPTEILYALGEQHRIVGISAYTERPPEARRDKPVVSAFTGGSVRKIRALEPDLVIGFSDIQAELARKLILANLPVLIFNQRSIQQILDVVLDLGRLVNQKQRAEALELLALLLAAGVVLAADRLRRLPLLFVELRLERGLRAHLAVERPRLRGAQGERAVVGPQRLRPILPVHVAVAVGEGGVELLRGAAQEEDGGDAMLSGIAGASEGEKGLFDQAVALVTREGKASTSFIQRHLQIGYNRAAKLIEQMEKEGIVGPANHVGKREVLARRTED